MGAMIEGKWDTGHHLLLPFRYKIALQMAPSSNCTAGQNHLDCAQGLQHYLFEEFVFREGVKKNCEKAVRLTALGGAGGSPPSSLTASICENFRTIYPLNMIH